MAPKGLLAVVGLGLFSVPCTNLSLVTSSICKLLSSHEASCIICEGGMLVLQGN